MYHSMSWDSRRKRPSTFAAISPSPVRSNVLKIRYVEKMVPLRRASADNARSRRENDACIEKTSGKTVPTATMLMEKSNEKSSRPLAQKSVAVAVATTMNNACHEEANFKPSHTSAAASMNRCQLLVTPLSLFSLPIPPVMVCAMATPRWTWGREAALLFDEVSICLLARISTHCSTLTHRRHIGQLLWFLFAKTFFTFSQLLPWDPTGSCSRGRSARRTSDGRSFTSAAALTGSKMFGANKVAFNLGAPTMASAASSTAGPVGLKPGALNLGAAAPPLGSVGPSFGAKATGANEVQALQTAGPERELVEELRKAKTHKSAVVCIAASWLPEPYIQAGLKWLRREAAKLSEVRFCFVLLDGHTAELLARLQIVHHHNLSVLGHADEGAVVRELLAGEAAGDVRYPSIVLLKAGKVEQVVNGLRPEDIETVCNKARAAKPATGGQGAPAPGSLAAAGASGAGLPASGAKTAGQAGVLAIPNDVALCRATVNELLADAAIHAKELSAKVSAAAAQKPEQAAPADVMAMAEQKRACDALLQATELARHEGAGQGRGSLARRIHEEGVKVDKDVEAAREALHVCEQHVQRAGGMQSLIPSELWTNGRCPEWLELELGARSALAAAHGAVGEDGADGGAPPHRLSPLAWSMQGNGGRRGSRSRSVSPSAHSPARARGDAPHTPQSARSAAWLGTPQRVAASPLDLRELGAVLEAPGESGRPQSVFESPKAFGVTGTCRPHMHLSPPARPPLPSPRAGRAVCAAADTVRVRRRYAGSSWQARPAPDSVNSLRRGMTENRQAGGRGRTQPVERAERQQAVRAVLRQSALFSPKI
jgi:hypothetical protein